MRFLKRFWARLIGGERNIDINADASGGNPSSYYPSQQDDG